MPRKKETAAPVNETAEQVKTEEKVVTKAEKPKKTTRSSSGTRKSASAAKSEPAKTTRKKKVPYVKVLFASSEVAPFAASGGLADVAGSLPVYLNRNDCDVRVILPLYSSISQQWREKMKFITFFYLSLSWRSAYCGVFELEDRGVTYYFIDNEQYFSRPTLYGEYDDGERFAFFSKAVIEALCRIDFEPDIIHCNDWQTALVPVYLRDYRWVEKLANVKTLFTIHNIQFQGQYDPYILGDLFGLPESDLPLMSWNGCLNLMKAAIELSDKVNTVSPTYAGEIMDPWYSFGLDPLLRGLQFKLCGILNGIDFDVWNPETDPAIPEKYSAADQSGKLACKHDILSEFGLSDDGRPLAVMIARLTEQKGVDLLVPVMDQLIHNGVQIAILGTGDKKYEDIFTEMTYRYPGSCSAKIAYNTALSKRMYAGADMFLMPSKTEPCGLAQMQAMRYGTVPIVRKTGGLSDSVRDCGDGEGWGFTFQNYEPWDMFGAIMRAKDMYYNNWEDWYEVRTRAMECDMSWNKSAISYKFLYSEMKG
ncbi:MAG: glycogen/starch synthase [Oscillospiraceae bacterium]|nr:glycogen/starch synthase [Oscillospiraceae bacterium]